MPAGNVYYYYYFKTKDDVVAAVIQARAERIRQGLAAIQAGEQSPRSLVREGAARCWPAPCATRAS